MDLVSLFDNSKNQSVIALGFFDCIHIGHLQLISTATNLAKKFGCQSALVTFRNNPSSVLGASSKLVYLYPERIDRLSALDLTKVIYADFDKEFAAISFDKFHQLLLNHKPFALVCGEDYHYGAKGLGDIKTLKAFCEKNEINLTVVDTIVDNGEKISSTSIRNLVCFGEIEKAIAYLGEDYRCGGKVESGFQMGRQMQFPTVNINWDNDKVLPKLGVYGGYCYINNTKYNLVANIGNRPTFEDEKIKLEAHIIGFEGNLYGQSIKIRLQIYIREIRQFSDKNQLSRQILRDVKTIEDYGKNRA